jgi:alanyl-tRNA synthetase
MTLRLYYDDPYSTRFTASVLEQFEREDSPAVVLDRTGFYPTGGGQPHDLGMLNGVAVVDVLERATDDAVIHVLAASLQGSDVEGEIDWERRFDLMQQHTGQHILSAAFLDLLGANTVGFHLSDGYATIDLDCAPLAAADVAHVERLANTVVFENRATSAQFVPDDEIPDLPLRKPVAHEGPVRIVAIPGFDYSACGGTHVRATGEIGLIKITRTERRGDETRVEFLCGRRALNDYQAKNTLVMNLASEFTVGHWELDDAVHRLADELRESRRELRRARDALLDAEATALWHQAENVRGMHLVRAHFSARSADELKHLAQRLVVHPETVALLATGHRAEEKSHFTFARSADLDLNMGALVRLACEAIGGRGGGRPEFAQGGGPGGDRVQDALDGAFRSVSDQLPGS